MSKMLKIAAALLFFTASMSTYNVYAAEMEASEDMVKACEEEAQGQNDPEAYIQQCVEDMMNMQKQEMEVKEKSE